MEKMTGKTIKKPIAIVLTNANFESRKRISRNIKVLEDMGYKLLVSSPHVPTDKNLLYWPLQSRSINDLQAGSYIKKIKTTLWFATTLPLSLMAALFSGFWLSWFLTTQSKILSPYKIEALSDVSLILVEDISLSLLGLKIKSISHAKLVLDLRDFYWRNDLIRSSSERGLTKIIAIAVKALDHLLAKKTYLEFLPKYDEVICVSNGHSKKLKKIFNINSSVVLSAVEYRQDLAPQPVNSKDIKLVYHGIGDRQRSIDMLIKAVNLSPENISLHLYLTDISVEYLESLRKIASRKIHFHEPIAYERLVTETNSCDIGLAVFPPLHSSLEDALPNKFFEYVQARLAVISGPSQDMSEIINKYDIGLVTKSFTVEDLRSAIVTCTPESILKMKCNSSILASKVNFESESAKLMGILSS